MASEARQMVVPVCSGCGQPAEEACGGAHLRHVSMVAVEDVRAAIDDERAPVPAVNDPWVNGYNRALDDVAARLGLTDETTKGDGDAAA